MFAVCARCLVVRGGAGNRSLVNGSSGSIAVVLTKLTNVNRGYPVAEPRFGFAIQSQIRAIVPPPSAIRDAIRRESPGRCCKLSRSCFLHRQLQHPHHLSTLLKRHPRQSALHRDPRGSVYIHAAMICPGSRFHKAHYSRIRSELSRHACAILNRCVISADGPTDWACRRRRGRR
jgi:hypothetical protein